jgi:hypothetical protein
MELSAGPESLEYLINIDNGEFARRLATGGFVYNCAINFSRPILLQVPNSCSCLNIVNFGQTYMADGFVRRTLF